MEKARPLAGPLCRIPSKFSKILWVRAGSFIVARFEEAALDRVSRDAKVTGEMTRALYHTQMKEMRRANRWPALFAETETEAERTAEDADEESGDADERNGVGRLVAADQVIETDRDARGEESSSSDSGDEE